MMGDSERGLGGRLRQKPKQGRFRRRLVAVMLVFAAVVGVLGYLERHTIYRQVMLAVVADTASDASDPEHQALAVLGEVRQIAPLLRL
jgi:hypothetical protein